MAVSEQERYIALKKEIQAHNIRYYEQDAPTISDFEYDILLRELEDLEARHPEWQKADSPTQNVGGAVRREMKKVQHEVPMQSLQDYFSAAELAGFINRVLKSLAENGDEQFLTEPVFCVEEKIDGLSVSLEYRHGKFWRASTRGDGHIGEDITENMLSFKDLPLELSEAVAELEVRAEVYMTEASFAALNEEQARRGEKLFANPRNAASGSLRQLDPEITRQRGLNFFVFNVQACSGKVFSTHIESLEFLAAQSFPLIKYYPCTANELSVLTAVSDIEQRRSTLPYGIDGAVVKVNSLAARAYLGETSKTPRWAGAYKYPPEIKETRLNSIEIQVGRTGKLTPLAILEPVLVAGSTIAKATLHNEDYIKDKDIRIGDYVYIHKAGDVIPAVLGVNLGKRDSQTVPYEMPQYCPICASVVERVAGEAASYCTGANCPAQNLRHLEHFVSRDNMNIEGLGVRTLEQFNALGWLNNIADIYRLADKRDLILQLSGFKETSVNKLLASIEKSKNADLAKFIAALGILHIGAAAARSLAAKYGSIGALAAADAESLQNTDEIGAISAQSILTYFANEGNRKLLADLQALGLNPQQNQITPQTAELAGLSFVITGRLPSLSRDEAEALIRKAGGTVSSSVSKKTNYLLLGEDAGSKATKAATLGVPSLSEAELRAMIGEA